MRGVIAVPNLGNWSVAMLMVPRDNEWIHLSLAIGSVAISMIFALSRS